MLLIYEQFSIDLFRALHCTFCICLHISFCILLIRGSLIRLHLEFQVASFIHSTSYVTLHTVYANTDNPLFRWMKSLGA